MSNTEQRPTGTPRTTTPTPEHGSSRGTVTRDWSLSHMSKSNIQTASNHQPKGSHSRENPTPVNTLSKNPTNRG